MKSELWWSRFKSSQCRKRKTSVWSPEKAFWSVKLTQTSSSDIKLKLKVVDSEFWDCSEFSIYWLMKELSHSCVVFQPFAWMMRCKNQNKTMHKISVFITDFPLQPVFWHLTILTRDNVSQPRIDLGRPAETWPPLRGCQLSWCIVVTKRSKKDFGFVCVQN